MADGDVDGGADDVDPLLDLGPHAGEEQPVVVDQERAHRAGPFAVIGASSCRCHGHAGISSATSVPTPGSEDTVA